MGEPGPGHVGQQPPPLGQPRVSLCGMKEGKGGSLKFIFQSCGL